MWATSNDLRLILGVTTDDLDDLAATKWIEKAQRIVRADTAVQIVEGEVIGDMDGKNMVFQLPMTPIGDSDWDALITCLDVRVYGYQEDNMTKTELLVSALNQNTGVFSLVNAPSGYSRLAATYFHSWMREDMSVVSLATALMAAYLYAMSEYAFTTPVDQKIGGLRFSFRGGLRGGATSFPYERFFAEYKKVVMPFRTKLVESLDRLEPGDVELEERGPLY